MREKRDYGQFCGLAGGLGVVGERWTLLVVRELLDGPARFQEVLGHLPGIGPNLLTERLKMLEREGVVVSEPVPSDGRGRQYRLTARGLELRGAVLELSRWGLQFLTEEQAETTYATAAWGFLAIESMIHGRAATPVDECYQFLIDGEAFHVRVEDGASHAVQGLVAESVITIATDARTFVRIGARLLDPVDAVLAGDVTIDGDISAVARCLATLGLATEHVPTSGRA